jgi:photosystem II stability/assembly factor-like uncharacterized protein
MMASTSAIAAASATTIPDSTWIQLAATPHATHSPVLALAVDPNQNQFVVGGTTDGSGEIFRSTDGGSSWSTVRSATGPVLTIAFSPFKFGLVLAGMRGGGVLSSTDSGATWSGATGMEGRTVRAFTFTRSLAAAGTDRGVYVSADGASWTFSALAAYDIQAIAAVAVNPPIHIVAAGHATDSPGGLVLYQSSNGASSWQLLPTAIGGSTIAASLVAGPLPPPPSSTRPLLAGTNAGLFESDDNGDNFMVVTGGGSLPATDFTRAVFVTDHFDRYYASSDGGGSVAGGIWSTSDGGKHFASLQPPQPAVTAMSVSNDESAVVYEASFSTSGSVVSLWAFHDTGAQPQQPNGSPSVASGVRTTPSPAPRGSFLLGLRGSASVLYVLLGVLALAVLAVAVVANVRASRR